MKKHTILLTTILSGILYANTSLKELEAQVQKVQHDLQITIDNLAQKEALYQQAMQNLQKEYDQNAHSPSKQQEIKTKIENLKIAFEGQDGIRQDLTNQITKLQNQLNQLNS